MVMDWFETAFEPEFFEQSQEPKERYLVVCVLSDKKSGESQVNEFLFGFQNKLNEISADGDTVFHKSFVYGDTRVCIKNFSEAEEREIYYIDACAAPVPDSHLMIIADSIVENLSMNSSAASVWLVLIKESAYGIGRADELTLINYYLNRKISYNLAMASYQIQEDWLEKFVKKQGGKVFSFEEVEKLVDYIRS